MFKSVLLCTIFVTATLGRKCVWPLGVKPEWPLVFHRDGSFYPSETINEEEVAIIPNKEYVVLSCKPNHFRESPEVKKIIATCRNGVLTGGSLVQGENFACTSSSVEEIVADVPGCPEGKTPVKFGYVHPIERVAHIIGEACYCSNEGRTLFAHVRLGSDEFTSLEVGDKDFFDQKKPDLRYKANFMYAFYRKVSEFASWSELNRSPGSLYNPEFEAVNFVDDYLLRNVQLAPVNELSWNFVALNSAVENFAALKKDIRALRGNINVYTGSYGVATIKGLDSDDEVQVYLAPERFPVPEFIWTVVRKDDRATAVIMFNDPTLTDADINNNSICNSKCHLVEWLKNTKYDDPTKGAVLCCEYAELRALHKEVPELGDISGLFV